MAQTMEKPFHGEPAVWLKAGKYEAAVLPGVGANLIAFRDTESGCRFLHEPAEEEMASFLARPIIHGIPLLFPPNRYVDGKFPWNGKTLQFPVNEERTGNHLHGFLHNIPWEVEGHGVNGEECYVALKLTVDEAHPAYQHLPFRFTFRLRYTLSPDGLQQQTKIRNDGAEAMPCLLAYHTSVNAPFDPAGQASDYRLKLTVGERWELDGRMLPTGRKQPLTADEEAMRGDGVYPFYGAMDNHYTAAAQNGRNRAELTDTRTGTTLVYDVGTSYKQWMIWNNNATEGFFCPEPQINLVNAPSVDLPADEIGLFSLQAGEIWEATGRLYVVNRG